MGKLNIRFDLIKFAEEVNEPVFCAGREFNFDISLNDTIKLSEYGLLSLIAFLNESFPFQEDARHYSSHISMEYSLFNDANAKYIDIDTDIFTTLSNIDIPHRDADMLTKEILEKYYFDDPPMRYSKLIFKPFLIYGIGHSGDYETIPMIENSKHFTIIDFENIGKYNLKYE